MAQAYTADRTYADSESSKTEFAGAEFENCTFAGCNLSNADFTSTRFVDCSFVTCNLSLITLSQTVFRDVKFNQCKMLGLLFYNCHPAGLSVTFDGCTVNHSSFYKAKLKKTIFNNTQLQEVDWTECDLTNSVFNHCDLLGAKFENSILEQVDFRTAFNYSIDPQLNRIKKAKFSVKGIAGLLDKYDIKIED